MVRIKRISLALLMFFVVLTQWDIQTKTVQAISTEPTYATATLNSYGSGTVGDPWRIYYLKQLAPMIAINSSDFHTWGNDHYILMNDLDFSDANSDGILDDPYVAPNSVGTGNWVPIGTADFWRSFSGFFNGDSHSIKNMKIDAPTQDYVGFFAQLYAGSFKNVNFVNVDVSGRNYTGGVLGFVYQGAIVNTVSVSGKVSGNNNVGGIAGHLKNPTKLQNVFNLATITGSGSGVGGIAGFAETSSATNYITNAYNLGDVIMTGGSTTNAAGGIVGSTTGTSASNVVKLQNVYNKGSITGLSTKGNLVGKNDGFLTLESAYYPSNELNAMGSDTGTTSLINCASYTSMETLLVSLNTWVSANQPNPFVFYPWRVKDTYLDFNKVIITSSGNTAYATLGTSVFIDPNLQILSLQTNKVVIAIDNVKTGDSLSYVDANGISGSYSNGILELSSVVNKTGAEFQTAARSVKFSTTGEVSDRTISFTINNGEADIPAYKTIAFTSYKVTYEGNGSTSGSVPTDSKAYLSNTSVTLLGNPGSLGKTGHTFAGWVKGSTTYQEGSTFVITTNTTVSAKWDLGVYEVIFVDFDDSELSTQTITYGETVIAPDNPVRSGYHFTGWDKSFDEVSEDLTIRATYEELIVEIGNVSEGLDPSTEGLFEAVEFTEEELDPSHSIGVKLDMTIKPLQNIDSENKELIESFQSSLLNNAVYTTLFVDINLYKIIDEASTQLSSTSQPVTITFTIPESLFGKTFSLIRLHTDSEGNTTLDELKYTYDPQTHQVTFQTDRFSIYGLVSASANIPNLGNTEAYGMIILWLGVLFGVLALRKEKKHKN